MKLPPITKRQATILHLLYRHRYLDRHQLQVLLGHKDTRRVLAWLKDLRDKHYITWIYNKDDFAEKTKPAIYYLSLNGIRYLRQLDSYPLTELRKRYKDTTRSLQFIERCLLLADCCITLDSQTTTQHSTVSYTAMTETDLIDPDNDAHFLMESDFIRPQLYYRQTTERDDEIITSQYLLEVIDATLPRYSLRKKLKGYVSYLDSYDWEEATAEQDLPLVGIVLPTKAALIYSKRITRKALVDTYGDDEDAVPDNVHIRLTTVGLIKQLGVTGRVWEEV